MARSEVTLPYDNGELVLNLPSSAVVAVSRAETTGPTIEEALASPLGTADLRSFLHGARRVVVIVNDGTRPTPTAEVLLAIWQDLREHRPTVVVATGCHRSATWAEHRRILGPLAGSVRVIDHDALAPHDLLGRTSRGTPMAFMPEVAKADRIVVVGSVEPHYFAGYTGGRKAFLPGVASYEAVERNHALALSPRAQPLALEGNPVHEDMVEAAAPFEDRVFSVQTVAGRGSVVAFAGRLGLSFERAVRACAAACDLRVERPAEAVVVAAPSPLDRTLYQAQKALENVRGALARGGSALLLAACPEGIGPSAFADLLASESDPGSVLRRVAEGYRLGWHKAARLAAMAMNGSLFLTSRLNGGAVRRLHMIPEEDPQRFVDEARDAGRAILCVPDGNAVVRTVNAIDRSEA